MKRLPKTVVGTVGRCIYCGGDGTSEEHVIPLSFGGHRVLKAASCSACAAITGALEGQCCDRMFRALRVHHELPTRRPKNRPRTLKVIDGKHPEGAPIKEVPVEEAPGVVVFPVLPPPGILVGTPPSEVINSLRFMWAETTHDAIERQRSLERRGFAGALATGEIPLGPFMRVLAKIAHCFDVANVGLSGTDGTLSPYILGTDGRLPYLVGGTPPGGPLPITVPDPDHTSGLHQVWPIGLLLDGVGYIAVQIRLFAHLRPLSPVYTVVMRPHEPRSGDKFTPVRTKFRFDPLPIGSRLRASEWGPIPNDSLQSPPISQAGSGEPNSEQ